MAILRAYDRVIDLITAVIMPQRLSSFRMSSTAQARMAELIARKERKVLRPAEALELEMYLDLERTFAVLRARDRQQRSTARAQVA